jgi:hypothetical protein
MTALWINIPADLIPSDATPSLGEWREEVEQAARGPWADRFSGFVFELMRVEIDANLIEYTLFCGLPIINGGIEYSGHAIAQFRPTIEHDARFRKRRVHVMFKGMDLARKRSEA